MKKVLLFAAFLISVSIIAQSKVAEKVTNLQKSNTDFKRVSVLSTTQNTINAEVNKVVEGATLAALDWTKVNEVVNNRYNTIE